MAASALEENSPPSMGATEKPAAVSGHAGVGHAAHLGKGHLRLHGVEQAFKVKVKDVRTIVTAGKVKRVGRNIGKRSAVKKAYVTLAEGTIDFFGV